MFGKYFASTFTGSMTGAGPVVFAVWGYVIANAVDSQVELNPRVLAALIGASEDDVRQAIEYLCRPDPESRNQREEGRRLVKEGAFAYRVVNHDIYRAIRDENDRRAYNRLKKQEGRARGVNTRVKKLAVDNGVSIRESTVSAQAEAEAEADTTTTSRTMSSKSDKFITRETNDAFETAWRAYPPRGGGNPKAAAKKAWDARLRKGANWRDMLNGVQRYQAYIRAIDHERTRFVMQAATFFGPTMQYAEPWEEPREPGGMDMKAYDQERDASKAFIDQRLKELERGRKATQDLFTLDQNGG